MGDLGGGTPGPTDDPWIFFLVNVATVAAVVAFPLGLQIAWTIGTPLLYGIVRAVQAQGDAAYTATVALDVSFTLILGGVLLTFGWLYRSVAANVDQARQTPWRAMRLRRRSRRARASAWRWRR